MVAVSIMFFKLQSNERRVSFVYDLLQEANLLPNLTIDGKSNKKSEEFRYDFSLMIICIVQGILYISLNFGKQKGYYYLHYGTA